ncbi:maltose O-acetyltransferase [Weissella uvarum]|uniref:sugar O-acetyltransferase n=1 Tax=Weissella uvarum TaxID=1479233 RepID=UPI00195F9497|nr:sugar O-acetyltransferase [Weissella uvarum]MBM7616585.1 maltose O-acetyltransferase [Weissella uvarum]MCM0594956.1 sugar O-acetyltransferase [Weissella uvarum]
MATEYEKMINGELYISADPELDVMRKKAHALNREYNTLDEDDPRRFEIMRDLFQDDDIEAYLQGPITFDYGLNTKIGKRSYANFNLTVLDSAKVTIGNDVMIGPNAAFLTPNHPLRYEDRNLRKNASGAYINYESALPITIGDNCWLGGNVTVLGGVTIGAGAVIGAGSVVTKDIPENVVAVGNPCRVLREITDADKIDLPEEN